MMWKAISVLAVCGFVAWCVGPAAAANTTSFAELETVMDSALVLEADIFAPKTWEKASRRYTDARRSIDDGKNSKTVEKHVAEAREYAENAIKAAEVAKLSLDEYLDPRKRARVVGAPSLVAEQYLEAEKQFLKATQKVESGDVKGALKEADKAAPLFDAAELEAIRVELFGPAARLIEKAVADDAVKFAPSTFDKARSALTKGNAIIDADRYNREAAIVEAARAEYEAAHASNIGLSVRSLNRNDQAWEKLMLIYEIQMNRVGGAAGLATLPFDRGPLAAADTLIRYIKDLQSENEARRETLTTLSQRLAGTLESLGTSHDTDDPLVLVDAVDGRLSDLMVEKSGLADQVSASEEKLAALTEENQEVTAELSVRRELEEKFKKAKQLLNPSEGEVLFNSSNDIVLRLSGLSFDVSKSDIKDDHVPLLKKIQQVIEMFPNGRLLVEGHTDSQGDPSANLDLSQKRAHAVMQYLRQSMLISADRITAIGYGDEKPVATNQTSDGRAKNRRIDIIIMQ